MSAFVFSTIPYLTLQKSLRESFRSPQSSAPRLKSAQSPFPVSILKCNLSTTQRGIIACGGVLRKPLTSLSSFFPPNIPPWYLQTAEYDDDGSNGKETALFYPAFVRQARYSSNRNNPPNFRLWQLFLALNVAVFLCQGAFGPMFTQSGAKINSLIAQGEMHRLFTPMFLHGSISHLLVNCMSLYSTGPSVESWFGRKRFVGLYLMSGICGNVLSYLCTPNASIGASGAIFGLVGASAVVMARHRRLLGPRARRGLQSLVYVVLVNFGMGLSPAARIDNFGHLGGFLGGIAYSYIAGPRLVPRKWGGKVLLIDKPLFNDVLRELRERLSALTKLLSK